MELIVEFKPVANTNGVIRDRSPQVPPVRIRITEARVRTRTGCADRSHVGRAAFSGGVTYDSGPQTMVDCQELVVPLDIIAPAFQETVMEFEIDGFKVGETVEVVGTLVYQPILFFRDFKIPSEAAVHLPGFKGLSDLMGESNLSDDFGARINVAKSLVYRWFGLFDVRKGKMGEELSQMLADNPLIQFPEVLLKSSEEFLQWYNESFSLVRQGYHEIDEVHVELDGANARVELTPLLHAYIANGQYVKVAYHIKVELAGLDNLEPKITSYTATPIPHQ